MKELGKKIREARIARKVDFKTIYEHTRIPVSTIQSIEKGEIGDLPNTYYRAFVRTIAKEVGLDGNLLLKEFDARAKQEAEIETEKQYEEHFSLNTFMKENQRIIFLGSIGLCLVVVILLYVIYGKALFYEPNLSDITQTSLLNDSLATEPFNLRMFGLKTSWVEIQIDSNDSKKILLKKGDESEWQVQQIVFLGLEDPDQVLLYLNETPLVWSMQKPVHGIDLWINSNGIVKQEVKQNDDQSKTKLAEIKSQPVYLIGHIEEDLLFEKVPIFETNRNRYQVDIKILDQIKALHPSLSLVCFLGTWDDVSQEVVPRLLKLIQEINLPGITLSIMGVDRNLKDRAGLVAFYQVQGIPTVIFISRGSELGRIVGMPEEKIETLFLDIIKKEALL